MGIGYVPSDRHRYGLIMSMKLTENMFLKSSFEHTLGQAGLDRPARSSTPTPLKRSVPTT